MTAPHQSSIKHEASTPQGNSSIKHEASTPPGDSSTRASTPLPPPQGPTVAFFGGTDTAGFAILKLLLEKSCPVRILDSKPSHARFSTLLSQYPSLLTVMSAEVWSSEAAADVLVDKNTDRVADVIITSLEVSPTFTRNPFMPGTGLREGLCTSDGTELQDGISGFLDLLADIKEKTKWHRARSRPLIIALARGVSDKGRFVPLAMLQLYHLLQRLTADDKRIAAMTWDGSWNDWVVVRPDLLINKKDLGVEKVKVRLESDYDSPEVGQGISIGDVATWVVHYLVMHRLRRDLVNTRLSISY